MKLKQLPLSVRVNLLAVPLAVMGLTVALIARYSLRYNSAELVQAREVKELAVKSLALLLTQDDASKTMMIDPDNSTAGVRKIEAYDQSRAVFTQMKELTRSPDLRQLMDRLDGIDEQELRPLDTEVLEAMGAGDRDRARQLYLMRYEPVRSVYESTLRTLVDVAESEAVKAAAKMSAQNDRSLRNICLALAVGVALSIAGISLGAHLLVCRPVRRMGGEMLAVAEARAYDRELDAAQQAGELAAPARAFNAVLRVVRANLAALHDANQNLEERVRSRTRELERANATMAAVQRATLDSVFVLDAQWDIVEFNDAAGRTFGCAAEQGRGRKLAAFFDPPPGNTGPGGFLLSHEATPFGRQIEVTAIRADGSRFPAEVAVTAARPTDGPPLYVASVRDISERKAAEDEREQLHARLLTASRQAGMAEVATGVLHNVGNVLNSVNISATVISDRLRASEVPSLQKAGGLLSDHLPELPRYLTDDPRGRHLPQFLIEVARSLAEDQEVVLKEAEAVARGLEHIKCVIGAQQSHAKRGVVLERVRPDELLDAAVGIQQESFRRHAIRLECAIPGNLPVVRLDRHKVLQVLLNLLTNAKHAVCDCREPGERTIAIALESVAAGEPSPAAVVRFRVTDNGVGIAAENLERIFALGFTTRPEGHGFGLHSAANAAREMGGQLRASSPGAGGGATFELEIPIPADDAAADDLSRQGAATFAMVPMIGSQPT